MDKLKTWPHLVIVGVVFAVAGAALAVWWFSHEQSVSAEALPNAARIERVEGEVGLNRTLDNAADQASPEWFAATTNTPVSVGDRLYTGDNSRTSIAFSGKNFARLDPNSSLDVLALSDQKTQVALREGGAMFDVGSQPPGAIFEVATPCGAVDLNEPGLYRIDINQDGNADVAALSGRAQIMGQQGTTTVQKGEVLSVACQGEASLSRLDAADAGVVVDDYYRYRYPRKYDGRYRSYYTYLDDPYYYEPDRWYSGYQYASDYIPGLYDLDDYGDWQYVNDYGYCWHPNVYAGWAPYQSGYWDTDYPYGLTWVSDEPWGYAPYHYGRWVSASNNWYWIPDRPRTRALYSPALVAFIPLTQSNSIGWVPLGPGDNYDRRYYDADWRPHFLTRARSRERLVNFNVPGAVTVVRTEDFNRHVDRDRAARIDRRVLASAQPVADPLAVDSLRRTALRTRGSRRTINVPPAVVERLHDTKVVTNTAPVALPFRRDPGKELRVERLPDRARNQKLALRDNRQGAQRAGAGQIPARNDTARQIAQEQTRERQMAALANQASKGNRDARRQWLGLGRQQRGERSRTQQAEGARVGLENPRLRSVATQPNQPARGRYPSMRERGQTQLARPQLPARDWRRESQSRAARPQQQSPAFRPAASQPPGGRQPHKERPRSDTRSARPPMSLPSQVASQVARPQARPRNMRSQPESPPQQRSQPQARMMRPQAPPQAARPEHQMKQQQAPQQKGRGKKP